MFTKLIALAVVVIHLAACSPLQRVPVMDAAGGPSAGMGDNLVARTHPGERRYVVHTW